MTVTLKDFFATLSYPVPPELMSDCDRLMTPQEAIGILRGVQSRIVQQIRQDSEKVVTKVATVFDQKIDEFSAQVEEQGRSAKKRKVIDLFDEPFSLEKIPLYIFSPFLAVAEAVGEAIASLEEKASPKLAANRDFIELLRKVGAKVGSAVPETVSARNVQGIVDDLWARYEELDTDVKALQKIAEAGCLEVVAESISDDVLKGMRMLFENPDAVEALKQAQVDIPSSITRKTIFEFLMEIDTHLQIDDEKTIGLKTIVKPYIDALFETNTAIPVEAASSHAPAAEVEKS